MIINKEEKIKQKANEILDNYKQQLEPRVYQLAKEEIENNGTKDKKQTPKLEEAKNATPKKKIVKRRKIEGTKE